MLAASARSTLSAQEEAMTSRFGGLPLACAALVGVGLFSLSLSCGAEAQNYPNRPITWIVPFAPGGLTDVPARLAATMMQEKIGQNIVIEIKTGGSGVVGATFAARATPD